MKKLLLCVLLVMVMGCSSKQKPSFEDITIVASTSATVACYAAKIKDSAKREQLYLALGVAKATLRGQNVPVQAALMSVYKLDYVFATAISSVFHLINERGYIDSHDKYAVLAFELFDSCQMGLLAQE